MLGSGGFFRPKNCEKNCTRILFFCTAADSMGVKRRWMNAKNETESRATREIRYSENAPSVLDGSPVAEGIGNENDSRGIECESILDNTLTLNATVTRC